MSRPRIMVRMRSLCPRREDFSLYAAGWDAALNGSSSHGATYELLHVRGAHASWSRVGWGAEILYRQVGGVSPPLSRCIRIGYGTDQTPTDSNRRIQVVRGIQSCWPRLASGGAASSALWPAREDFELLLRVQRISLLGGIGTRHQDQRPFAYAHLQRLRLLLDPTQYAQGQVAHTDNRTILVTLERWREAWR
jgi:hypothetical protein